MASNKNKNVKRNCDGFTITELMTSVAIVGMLSGVAMPKYLQQAQKARQADVANQITQIISTVQAYREEFLDEPRSWDDLARVMAVSTATGTARGGSYSSIQSPNGGHYRISISPGSRFSPTRITASPTDRKQDGWSVRACINTESGVMQIEKQSPNSNFVYPSCS